MKNYLVTVKHDYGKVVLKLFARSKEMAMRMACSAEKCPESAILKIVPEKKKK